MLFMPCNKVLCQNLGRFTFLSIFLFMFIKKKNKWKMGWNFKTTVSFSPSCPDQSQSYTSIKKREKRNELEMISKRQKRQVFPGQT